MGKKIDWFNGKNALNDYDMQELCDQIVNVDTPQNLAEVIKGSESVVVDVSKDNKFLEIHLDASAGDAKLYQHFVKLSALGSPIAVILSRSAEVFTVSSLASYLYNNGFTGSSGFTYPVSTRVSTPLYTSKPLAQVVLGVSSNNGSALYIRTTAISATLNEDNTISTSAGSEFNSYDVSSITDTVLEV